MAGVVLASPGLALPAVGLPRPRPAPATRRSTRSRFVGAGVPLFLGGAFLAYVILPQTAKILLDFTPDGRQQPAAARRLPRPGHPHGDRLRPRLRAAAAAGPAQPHRRAHRQADARLVARHGHGHHRLRRRRHPHRRPADDAGAGRARSACCTSCALGISPAQRPQRKRRARPRRRLDDDEASELDLTPEPIGAIEPVGARPRPARADDRGERGSTVTADATSTVTTTRPDLVGSRP